MQCAGRHGQQRVRHLPGKDEAFTWIDGDGSQGAARAEIDGVDEIHPALAGREFAEDGASGGFTGLKELGGGRGSEINAAGAIDGKGEGVIGSTAAEQRGVDDGAAGGQLQQE